MEQRVRAVCRRMGGIVPAVGWSVEQRAAVKRYMLFTTVFAVIGVAFSVFLIASGVRGGWVFLGMVVCMYAATLLFVGNVKRKQPEE
ncbi:hypothetical protein AB0K93_23145 [Streptomyces sp. NPDC052676]|uniref:hypothetical protein n=1 Tax=Streptomyces sp. NPDC052676 TaxID=3154953 RepID=UPI003421B294